MPAAEEISTAPAASLTRAYPVHFSAERPARFTRIQLLVRVLAFVLLGWLGLSLGTIFAFAYLALPVYAAARLASLGSPEAYVREERVRVARFLHWLAALSAWIGLVVDRLPARDPGETVSLVLDDTTPKASAGSTLLRILTGLPSAFGLAVLGFVGMFVWLWAAVSVLLHERVGKGAFDYLVGVQRWSVRLLVHQAGLVDEYPPFTLEDTPPALPSTTAPA